MILATRFTFTVEKSWKNMYFQQKMASPPATYDVIFRNHSNWPSLCARDERTATENVRCWVVFILSVKTQKNLRGGIHPPPLYVRGLNKARMGVPKVFWLETPLPRTSSQWSGATYLGREVTVRAWIYCLSTKRKGLKSWPWKEL